MRRAVPGIVHSTTGQASRAEPARARAYRYHNRPGWPFDPASRDDRGEIETPKDGALARSAEKRRKLAEFTAARAEGLGVTAAGERAGVARKTAAKYERERLMQGAAS